MIPAVQSLRLISYARVSTDEQAENGHSLALLQPQINAEYCERMGHTLVEHVVDEGVSAGKPFESRAGGRAVMELLEAGEADGVVCWKLERLFRIGLDALQVGTWFLTRGLHIASATEHIDIQTPEGWMTFGVMALNAEYDRKKIMARATDISRCLLANARQYGPVPYGCVAVDGLLFRDPATWPRRERVVQLRQAGYSYRAMEKILRGEGIPAPSGGNRWHPSTVRNVVESHHELQHIPWLPGNNETEASLA